MSRRLAVVLATMLLAPTTVHAAALSGGFVEKGRPLPGVEVVLLDAADSTVVAHTSTAADGRFRLDGIRLGRFRLRASLLGYRSFVRRDLSLTESAPSLDLGVQELAVSPIAVPGVETSTARATAIVASDRNIYLAKDLPGAGAGAATDVLRAVPELELDVDDRVSLRGSSSVTIHVNGRPSPLQGDALTTILRQFPATRIERVEVIANPSAKFDPEGTSGIVNLVTRDPLDLGLSGSVFVSIGNRGGGPSTRIAWQEGRVTLYGGVSAIWNRFTNDHVDERDNWIARPPSSYRMGSENDRRNRFGNGDGSIDFAFDKRSTLYGTATGWRSSGRNETDSGWEVFDSTGTATSRYLRATDGDSYWRTGTVTAGFRHVVEASKREWTVEFRQSETSTGSRSDAAEHHFVPVDSAGLVSRLEGNEGTRERSFQADDTHPIGARGKLQIGYRGMERRTAGSSRLSALSGGSGGGLADYVHREVFHSGYLTLGSTFGKLSVDGGVRAEAANTTFDVIPQAKRHDLDYRSVFPSANAAWDVGGGRTLRATYSKRIERPTATYLNPEVPALDPLNRTAGNPALTPKYTHSYALEASWTGSRGLLRVSPFYRETVDNWDQFKTVDSLGAALTTWRNASAVRFLGGSVVASLRQVGRLGGTMNLSVYREEHDASNLASKARYAETNWSLSGNATYKVTPVVDLQCWVRYSPAQTHAQGRVSGVLFTNVGARYKLGEKAWISAFLSDPLDVWKYRLAFRDASYSQVSTTSGSMRRIAVSGSWSWGKPPETKPRKHADEPPATDPAP